MQSVKLVGILNLTPDSFSDGDPRLTVEKAVERAKKLIEDGADIIDVGAEATNPFVDALTAEQEWGRLEPFLAELLRIYPSKISLDTYHAKTAAKALALGPVILNDVTTFRDPDMIDLAVAHQVQCIVSHLPFGAKNIADAHANAVMDSVSSVREELLRRRDEMIAAGVEEESIILDPGIGFGKTMKLNEQLLEFAKEVPGTAVLIGHSRKRFLGDNRFELEPNLAAAKEAILHGAAYLRVHDVKAHKELISRLQK